MSVDADKSSISIESDIVIEEDENIKDDVDISESWKNSMTSFDQNDGYDSNASSSFMGSAVKASLSQSTNIESSPRPDIVSETLVHEEMIRRRTIKLKIALQIWILLTWLTKLVRQKSSHHPRKPP